MPFETNLWRWLHDGVKPLMATRRLHICRVENSVSAGYPDVEGCLDGRNFHLELKGALRPIRASSPVRVEIDRGQVLWLHRRWDAGGSCFLLIRVGKGVERGVYLLPGSLAGQVEEGRTEGWMRHVDLLGDLVDPQCIVQTASRYRTPPVL